MPNGYDYDTRTGINLDFLKAKLLFDYLNNFWESEYYISCKKEVMISFYGGEPLLNMKFIKKVIEYLNVRKYANVSFKFNMTTNGMLLKRNIDYLIENDFSILISLDGDEYSNSYRVDKKNKNSFSQVVSNINFIKEKYPEYYNSKVEFSSVLHDRNSANDIYYYIKTQFQKTPMISSLSPIGICEDLKEEFSKLFKYLNIDINQSENCNDLVNNLGCLNPDTRALNDYFHAYSGNVFKSYNELFKPSMKNKIIPTGTCYPFGRKLFVTANGKILPCERISHKFCLGDITNERVNIDFHY